MKRFLLCLLVLILLGTGLWAQSEEEHKTSVLISPDILALIFGTFKINFEIPFDGGLSLEFEPSYFNIKSIPLVGAAIDESFDLWIGGARVGANYYFSGDAPNGFFIGAWGNAGYAFVGSSVDNLTGMQIGAGAKIGFRWVWDWFSLAPQIGIGYNKYLVDFSSQGFDTMVQTALEGPYYPVSLGIALAF